MRLRASQYIPCIMEETKNLAGRRLKESLQMDLSSVQKQTLRLAETFPCRHCHVERLMMCNPFVERPLGMGN